MTDVKLPPQPEHPGHLLPPEEWARVQRDAKAIAAAQKHKTARGRENRLRGLLRLTLGRSSFPSVTGFVQAKYSGGAQPAGGPKFGVLHDAETPLANGYAGSIASYFTRNTNQTSAHFMVGPEATYQLLDTGLIAWHCGNGNLRSIGVEQTGYASLSTGQWTTAAGMAQIARVAQLMREIHAAHGIGLHWMSDAELAAAYHGQVVGGWATHDQCRRVLGGTTHTDPMPNYPLNQLMAMAQPPAPTPPEDDLLPDERAALLRIDAALTQVGDGTVGLHALQARDASTDADNRSGFILTAVQTQIVPALNQLVAAANKGAPIDVAKLEADITAGVSQQVLGAVGDVVRTEMGKDNAEQADAIVAAIAAKLGA